ncbi:MAG: cobalamin B12-binding domain-containing protein [Clostridia bacterium]|nr:MAG: cobalamin B12-binding domain-containing protein [Clostridia bacterium]
MEKDKRIRVLMAKIGLDGHDVGMKVLTRGLRDAGMEVVYLGLHQTPEMVANAAMQEDVDVIGISSHQPNHSLLIGDLMRLLKEKGLDNITVIAGGTIWEPHLSQLKEMGVAEVFLPGTPIESIAEYIRSHVRSRPN